MLIAHWFSRNQYCLLGLSQSLCVNIKLLLSITGFSLLIVESLLIIINLMLTPQHYMGVVSYYYLIVPGILAYIFILLAYSGFKGYGILVVSMILLIISDLLTVSFFPPRSAFLFNLSFYLSTGADIVYVAGWLLFLIFCVISGALKYFLPSGILFFIRAALVIFVTALTTVLIFKGEGVLYYIYQEVYAERIITIIASALMIIGTIRYMKTETDRNKSKQGLNF